MYSKHVLWMGGLDQSERSHKEELHSRLETFITQTCS